MNRTRNESGQAVPVAAFLVCAMVFVAMIVTHTARAGNDEARAQTAADASALAGVTTGEEGADEAARRNGGELLTFDRKPNGTQVTVEVAGRTAVARARQGGGLGSGDG